MSLTCGFYNAVDHDRLYNALQMSSIFDGIINDGVYMGIGDHLAVSESSGMVVSIGTGRAWFDHTWTLNDALMLLTVPQSEVLLNRIDAVVLEVNNTSAVRANSIKIVKGTPDAHPVAPTLTNTDDIHQHLLALIDVDAGVTEIHQADITNKIGTTDTPFVTGIIETIDITSLIAQWEGEWNVWLADIQGDAETFLTNFETEMTTWKTSEQTSFTEWMAQAKTDFRLWEATIHDILDSGTAGHLQNEIDAINQNINQYGDLIAYQGWNQQIKNGNFADNSNWTVTSGATLSISSNKATVAFSNVTSGRLRQSLATKASHKYLFSMYITPNISTAINVEVSRGTTKFTTPSYSANQRVLIGGIMTVTGATDTDEIFQIYPSAASTVIFEKVMFIDLTEIYGAGNEPLTVDDFRRLFTQDFYEYHIAGQAKSAEYAETAGSATNADTLDGKHASDFTTVSGDNSIFSTQKYVNIPDGTDLNSIKTPGTYGTAGYDGTHNIVNSPFGNNPFNLLVENQMKAGQGFIRQTAKKYNSNTIMTRYSNDTGSTWSTWASIAMSSETKPAWQISSGTFLGQVNADATSAANTGTFQMRDIRITSTDPGEGSALDSGKIIIVV